MSLAYAFDNANIEKILQMMKNKNKNFFYLQNKPSVKT